MYLSIVLKLLIGMIGILFFLRLSGKTQMGQVTPLDTVNSFILGAFLGGVIYSPDLSVWIMLFAIFIWGILNWIIRMLSKNGFFNQLINGKSDYLIKDGILNMKALKKNNLKMEQFKTILRENDIFSFLDVDSVRFETNGQLSIFKKEDEPESFLLISNGDILHDTLKDAERSESWLKSEMNKIGFSDIEKIFCLEWTPSRGFYIVDMDGKIQDKTKKSKTKELDNDKTV